MNDDYIMETDTAGFLSRKFILVVLAMLLISLGGILAIYSALFAGLYPTFGGLILSAITIYFTGNITHSVMAGKINSDIAKTKIKALGLSDKNEGE